ncbi:hypothetical protein [Endozoicomonas ascidiicola]|uniref:hypothetical protein n=1 Tax=Endozoicomonas ascidiicola TaxID=1698521 RepID=UPI0008338277|nr:hypothetical protein [Endozoicomonas ascidiicola]
MNKPAIYFSMINAVADLPELHNLSDAGAGLGLMGYTPANNTEMIVTGRDITPLPGIIPQPLLTNNAITPALLVHSLLQLLRRNGYEVHMRVYNIDLPVTPDLPPSLHQLDSVQQWHCDCDGIEALINEVMLPNLQQEANGNNISLIGECGVGSTLFSSLWFSLLMGEEVPVSGSTKASHKLEYKRQVINKLRREVLGSGITSSTESLLSQSGWHDSFQKTVSGLLQGLMAQDHANPVWLAGGLMFVAPWLMHCHQNLQRLAEYRQRFQQVTTRWVYTDTGQAQSLLTFIKDNIEIRTPVVNFSESRHPCVELYEQGLVVEGCGLGGCLYLAEYLGFSSEQIIAVIDEFVDEHFSLFNVSGNKAL